MTLSRCRGVTVLSLRFGVSKSPPFVVYMIYDIQNIVYHFGERLSSRGLCGSGGILELGFGLCVPGAEVDG